MSSAVASRWQQLLAAQGGDLFGVIATQANLRVRGSAELIERFYRLFVDEGMDVGQALNYARRVAYNDAIGWSVPIAMQRPSPESEQIRPSKELHLVAVPRRRETYLTRASEEEQILADLNESACVALVGLPGIGKTEIGQEIARRAKLTEQAANVYFATVQNGDDPDAVRTRLSLAILGQPAESDADFAKRLSELPGTTLLVLDNVEDLMLDIRAEERFVQQLETLVSTCPDLRLLLTTRWLPAATDFTIRQREITQLSAEQTSELLEAELREMGVLHDEWLASPAWQKLLELLDGHARSLWLVAQHFRQTEMNPERVAILLEKFREAAVVDKPELIGRADKLAQMGDRQKRRLKSLVGSMDLSFSMLREQYPEAAELFAALGFYPAGLPEMVAEAAANVAAGETRTVPLIVLTRFHLVAFDTRWRRYSFPVPLQWYAASQQAHLNCSRVNYDRAVLDSFDDFCDGLDTDYHRDPVRPTAAILKELETLLVLANSISSASPSSTIGSIANSLRNMLKLSNEYEALHTLASAGKEHARAAGEKWIEAGCILTLGLVAMRVSDLSGAGDAYEEALPIYREIKARLGEANCLKSLGDLRMRVSDLSGAGEAYEEALPIYREIKDRLGEANCLQAMALLDAQQGNLVQAFQGFLEVKYAFESIESRLGVQAALGYMARIVAEISPDQAVLLAEQSIEIGREIEDRFGQSINLELQLQLFVKLEESAGMVGACAALVILYRKMKQAEKAQGYEGMLASVASEMESSVERLLIDGEVLRVSAIQESAKRFEAEARDLFSLPTDGSGA